MVPAAEVNGDKRRSRLDQPPSQQRALSPVVPAILIAQPRVFLVDVERPARRVARHQLERLLIETVHRLGRAGRVDAAPQRVEVGRQLAAISAAARP